MLNFTNIGDNVKVNGTDTIARITLKAKKDITWDMEISNALLVDSKLNSKKQLLKLLI